MGAFGKGKFTACSQWLLQLLLFPLGSPFCTSQGIQGPMLLRTFFLFKLNFIGFKIRFTMLCPEDFLSPETYTHSFLAI